MALTVKEFTKRRPFSAETATTEEEIIKGCELAKETGCIRCVNGIHQTSREVLAGSDTGGDCGRLSLAPYYRDKVFSC